MWYSDGVRRATLRSPGIEGVSARSLLRRAAHSGRVRIGRPARAASWQLPPLLAWQLGRNLMSHCTAFWSPTDGMDGFAALAPTACWKCSEGS